MNQKTVKIINFRASKFGVFEALELDFDKFNEGAIAIKGNAGAGKSTIQNGLKTNILGRNNLADQDQYGDDWEMETSLLDGDRKIFIGAVKKAGKTIEYKLFEKDSEGKKVMSPVIDGIKATPAKYMEIIATELTFGINKFLSPDATTHRKFMFELFRPELEKLGVVFDKKDSRYKETILGQLDDLTYERDRLRSECTHKGAFMADFERQGLRKEDLSLLSIIPIEPLNEKRNDILVSKGQAEGNAKATFEKSKSEIIQRGQKITEEIRVLSEQKTRVYGVKLSKYNSHIKNKELEGSIVYDIKRDLSSLSFLKDCDSNIVFGLKRDLQSFIDGLEGAFNEAYPPIDIPIAPICPQITDGVLKNDDTIIYEPDFIPLVEKAKAVRAEYSMLQPIAVNLLTFDTQMEEIDKSIASAKSNNDLVERFDLNREWVEASCLVDKKRKELAKLYAQIDTGVAGLYMKPFFNDDGKVEIKTVYTGNYSPDFFRNDGTDERLLVSYSSTQRPIIGILLQVARLKIKSKALNYIFLDDVPMDSRSRQIITKIAADNNLNIITSITGDFTKEKLTENELLVENGHVFFNDDKEG